MDYPGIAPGILSGSLPGILQEITSRREFPDRAKHLAASILEAWISVYHWALHASSLSSVVLRRANRSLEA